MCEGIAIACRDFPEELIERHQLQNRVTNRRNDAEREIRFLYAHPRPMIPAWYCNELNVFSWGDPRRSRLPATAWCSLSSLEAGQWAALKPERVTIPATVGREKGVWFQIREGIEGILVRDEQNTPHVYMLTDEPSHYYRIMTRSDRMPVLIGETI